MDVGADVVRYLPVRTRDAGEAVSAVGPQQQQFAPVAEHELQVGVAIESAADDQAQGCCRRLNVLAQPKVAKARSVMGSKPLQAA